MMRFWIVLCLFPYVCPTPATEIKCRIEVTETIPTGLYPNVSISTLSTYDAWTKLLKSAESNIDTLSFYWSLLEENTRGYVHSENGWTSDEGKKIYNLFMQAGAKRNVSIRVVEDITNGPGNPEVKRLVHFANAKARGLNFTALLGAGVLHSKLILVDQKHAYIGSANLDWRALTEVKELGLLLTNCSDLVSDLQKVFQSFWVIAETASIPNSWSHDLWTTYNYHSPMIIDANNQTTDVYVSSAPPVLNPTGRMDDLEAILHTISTAKKFIHISVMDFFPRTLYSKPIEYWPVIEDALKTAAFERRVKVKLLASYWPQTRPDMKQYLTSYNALNKALKYVSFETKFFNVTSNEVQASIPFARVNHAKYMVTDNSILIGTSNWSKDYFTFTSGLSIVLMGEDIDVRKTCANIFMRDWRSEYTILPENV